MTDTFFEFSVRANLKHAWHLFRTNLWYFLVIAAVMAVLNVFFNTNDNLILRLIAVVLILVWSYVSLSSVLAVVDGKKQMLQFESLKLHMPTLREFGMLVAVIFGCAVIIGVGFVLLVIPGVYFTIRLMFTNFAFIDRKEGVKESMRFSWHMVRKDVFWTALLCFVIATILIMLGIALVGVGILVTYPVTLIFLALLYRKLIAYHHAAQPTEPAA
jgi:uncharacterized membrane protein